MEDSQTYFSDIVATQHDHPTYVLYVLGGMYVFFTLFGYWVGAGRGGGSQGIGTQPTYALFHPGSLNCVPQ